MHSLECDQGTKVIILRTGGWISMCKVSTIIPTYNSPHYLIEALESVLSQTYKDMEIVIVDDGSTDNTKEVIQSYLILDRNIKYIYQNNGGTASARNTGIKFSSGEYIAFLDHDDIWLPQKTELQIKILDSDPSIGLVYCRFQIMDEDKGSVLEPPKRELCRGGVYEKFLVRCYINTASQVMIRKACIERVGYFDESLQIVDDYDFYIRVARHYKIEYLDQPLANWRIHRLNTSKAIEKMISNRIALRKKILKDPDLSKKQRLIVKQVLRRDYFELGYYYISSCELKSGRKYFLKSLRYKPLRSCIYLISSYLPIPAFKAVRELKQYIVRHPNKVPV